MQKQFFLVISAFTLCCGASGVQAAEVIVHDDDAYTPAEVYRNGHYRLAPRDRLTVRAEGPAVYGWSFRPANCGVFHYWNEDECVDARAVPAPQ
jgi:hypothetical protein